MIKGILLYEIFHRKPPYNTRSMDELEDMVNTKPLVVGKFVDPRVKSLIQKILKKNSSERLSCQEILQSKDFLSLLRECNLLKIGKLPSSKVLLR